MVTKQTNPNDGIKYWHGIKYGLSVVLLIMSGWALAFVIVNMLNKAINPTPDSISELLTDDWSKQDVAWLHSHLDCPGRQDSIKCDLILKIYEQKPEANKAEIGIENDVTELPNGEIIPLLCGDGDLN